MWMLAYTIKDMTSIKINGAVGVGAKDPSKIEVLNAIDEIGTEAAYNLIKSINTAGSQPPFRSTSSSSGNRYT
jgi:hypothetical protein